MQSNQDIAKMNPNNEMNIIDNTIWEELTSKLSNKENKIDVLVLYVYDISLRFNIDKKNIIKDYINYIIRNKNDVVNADFLNFVENLLHSQETNNRIFIYYALSRLSSFLLEEIIC